MIINDPYLAFYSFIQLCVCSFKYHEYDLYNFLKVDLRLRNFGLGVVLSCHSI